MAYVVDPRTLMFTDEITEDELEELTRYCTKIVLEGHRDLQHPAFRAWIDAAKYNENQELLVYATAFPQRALLSIIL